MTGDESGALHQTSRRMLLRNAVLVGAGAAVVGVTSTSLAGSAQAAPARLSRTQPLATPDSAAAIQWSWAWCSRVQGLYYAHSTGGNCPADHKAHGGEKSYNYGLYYNGSGTGYQAGWDYCRNCERDCSTARTAPPMKAVLFSTAQRRTTARAVTTTLYLMALGLTRMGRRAGAGAGSAKECSTLTKKCTSRRLPFGKRRVLPQRQRQLCLPIDGQSGLARSRTTEHERRGGVPQGGGHGRRTAGLGGTGAVPGQQGSTASPDLDQAFHRDYRLDNARSGSSDLLGVN